MKVIKGGQGIDLEVKTGGNDISLEQFLESMKDRFIIQVINADGEKRYLGRQDGKLVTVSVINTLAIKFKSYIDAKEFAKGVNGAQKNIIGYNRIKTILEKQETQASTVTDKPIPIDQVGMSLYHIVVKQEKDDKLIGYISANKEGSEFNVLPDTNNASVWQDEQGAEKFIEIFTKAFAKDMEGLKLEKLKYN